MKKISFLVSLLGMALLVGCVMRTREDIDTVKKPVDYVNPYMGNISHLLVPTFPTVHLPNSMLRCILNVLTIQVIYLMGFLLW